MSSGVPIRPDLAPAKSSLDEGRNPKAENSQGEERDQIQKVTKGEVTVKKPSVAKRFVDTFIAEDLDHVKEYLIFDVVIPAIKDTFMSSLNMMLFGTPNYRGRGGYSNGRNERVSYWSYGDNTRNERRDRGRYIDRSGPRDVRDLLFETRMDAEEVIGVLEDTIDRYGKASIADLYDAAGVTGEYTDHRWGWTRGAEFRVRPVSGGYVIDMPRYRALD